MNVKLPQDLRQKALILLILEVIFGTMVYVILRRSYHGQLWLELTFWVSLVIGSLVFAVNLQLLVRIITARKKLSKDQKIAIAMFCVSLLYVIALNLLYWSQTSS